MNALYDFQRWYYFEYAGCHALDEHKAEQHYYQNGGEIRNYPGEWEVWKTYFSDIDLYAYKPVKASDNFARPMDFCRVDAAGKQLNISQLITIDEIIKFSNQNPEYFEHREAIERHKPDRLDTMNADKAELPAAVTWFDACMYLSFLEKKHGLPLRLLKLDEYRAIREECSAGDGTEDSSLLEYCDDKGKQYGARPPYMAESDFQALTCKYTEEPKFLEHTSGLKFVDSDRFCEWLNENPYGMEAIAIRSRSLLSARGSANVERDLFPAWSTGKYHYCKIGFRVCYELA
ncbi:hypothetical protein [Pelagibaculum spongiae]|uniref:Sulfatase-modifying factor enzyme domain-containing protein n=1 Tax=Pelagibaculum spongiae TaxID=2080658 RepID=A0A2V1GV34_9GAMM|nr:hypothetical protein [Pelagibaculum spongiae]PVZ66758.1 hypothetical protein DC094_15960 [Pelagibaculum spongiae]